VHLAACTPLPERAFKEHAMRYAATILALLALSGCARDEPSRPRTERATLDDSIRPPELPVPPAPGSDRGVLWGFVIDATGGCIDSATVRVVRGQALGQTREQETPCDRWSYGGGFIFQELVGGDSLTLRASAPGYHDREQSFAAFSASYFTTIAIELAPKR
jgi:hypothetical protein